MPAAMTAVPKTIARSCLPVMAELRRGKHATKVWERQVHRGVSQGHDFDMLGL